MGGVDLHRRTEERKAADAHLADVQHDAVEVEEHPLAQLDVRAVVAEEGRLHPHRVPSRTEQFAQDSSPFLVLRFARGVQRLTEISRMRPSRNQLGIERVVQLSGQHLLMLCLHRALLGSGCPCRAQVRRPQETPLISSKPEQESRQREHPSGLTQTEDSQLARSDYEGRLGDYAC
jgi:hypothetical protein